MPDRDDAIDIEGMTLGDVPQVHTLEVLCFPTPWDKSAYYREAQNPTACYLVARRHDRVIGFGGMWVIGDEGHIVTLAVHPDFRRHGVGRRLMEALLAEARQRRVERVTLEVRVHNTAAQHLYHDLGFVIIGYRRDYYPDNGEDAAVMALELPVTTTDTE